MQTNAKYDNPGQPVTNEKKEDSVKEFSREYPPFKSKYIVSFEEFIEGYPIVDERVVPYLKAAYDKNTSMVIPYLFVL
ncbi:MAG: hypothetical protein PWP45_668 [Tepidanaerobacteraceae bacterium]|nr:hypothetical protein [Tepidanaerobacteraceae bacterium]